MRFRQPVYVGDLLTLHARVTAVWRTSLETEIDVWAENVLTGARRHAASAFLVFVALDDAGRPARLPTLALVTDQER